ncbi:MAG TPA: hypothetical protein VL240_10715, partial [Candidatus Binatia bacterium]|nr:hypothetical protein [Candidatus Binatia bacterium]
LFCVVLALVLEADRTASVRKLYWLPIVFLFWANLHIQFIYGLVVVGLLLAVIIAQQLAGRLHILPGYILPRLLPAQQMAIVFALCVLATLIGPYSWHLYAVIWKYSQARVPYSMVFELQPFGLGTYSSYAQLLLACVAFLAVGWQKKIDLFRLSLLVLTTAVAFRTTRDAWFQCIAAAACIAGTLFRRDEAGSRETVRQLGGVFAAVALIAVVGATGVDFSQRGLERAMRHHFPVDAANFLRQNSPPGPLWSIFDWGGFLIWYLPQYPVGIDGRTDLYGDATVSRFFQTELGEAGWRDDAYLNESGVVLLRTRDELVRRLEEDPRFDKVYKDPIATLFVRR